VGKFYKKFKKILDKHIVIWYNAYIPIRQHNNKTKERKATS